MIRIRHLYVSPGHNFFGHHGRSASAHPMVEVDEVECLAGRGLRGDRFFDFKQNYKGQVTFFAVEVFESVNAALGLTGLSPEVTRRNVITEGVELNQLIGCEFMVQNVRFEGIEECRPCCWMNRAFRHQEAKSRLRGHGGLRARILTDGVLRRDP